MVEGDPLPKNTLKPQNTEEVGDEISLSSIQLELEAENLVAYLISQ